MKTQTERVDTLKEQLAKLRIKNFAYDFKKYKMQVQNIRTELSKFKGSNVSEADMCKTVIKGLQKDPKKSFKETIGAVGKQDYRLVGVNELLQGTARVR